ncbi:hypothetical protein [Streptomyces sp. YGL11-2]|uniref:hypothetical protein n=1 Tax=Streptomyces sp. YGL11-2 TaxID=3414028 RepID=UPI003CF6E4C5
MTIKITQPDGDLSVTVRNAPPTEPGISQSDSGHGLGWLRRKNRESEEGGRDIHAGSDTQGDFTLTVTFPDGNREDK